MVNKSKIDFIGKARIYNFLTENREKFNLTPTKELLTQIKDELGLDLAGSTIGKIRKDMGFPPLRIRGVHGLHKKSHKSKATQVAALADRVAVLEEQMTKLLVSLGAVE
jgi:hypothetical protein